MSAEPLGTAAPAGSLREVLTGQLRRMLLGIGLSSLGGGLVLSLLVVYLHQVRDIPLETAGLVLASQAVLGLLFSPVVGALVDRIGPKPVLLVACVVEAVGTVALGFVQSVPAAFAAAGIVALGNTGLWAPSMAAITRSIGRSVQPLPAEHGAVVIGVPFSALVRFGTLRSSELTTRSIITAASHSPATSAAEISCDEVSVMLEATTDRSIEAAASNFCDRPVPRAWSPISGDW